METVYFCIWVYETLRHKKADPGDNALPALAALRKEMASHWSDWTILSSDWSMHTLQNDGECCMD